MVLFCEGKRGVNPAAVAGWYASFLGRRCIVGAVSNLDGDGSSRDEFERRDLVILNARRIVRGGRHDR